MGSLLPFTEINGFVLEKVIQDNPNSLAVKAYQPALKRPVFIKLLKPHIQDHQQWVERFTREAQVCARLKNSHIVDVYTIGEKEGYTYMALEYVEGLSLKELLEKEGSLSVFVALEIARQVLLALDFSHQQGIIHRDIKPGNILIDIYGMVRVTDFGLAYLGQESSLTQAGSILGTPAYMAPEQITGESLSPATDIFALGATLYEMLTGIKPFAGENYSACIQKILNEVPDKPSRIQPRIPDTLDRIVMWMIEKTPEARPQSAAELLQPMVEILPAQLQTETGKDIARLIRKYYAPVTHPERTESQPGSVSSQPVGPPSDLADKNNYWKIFTGVGLIILLFSIAYIWKQNSTSVSEGQSLSTPAQVSRDSPKPADEVAANSILSEGKENERIVRQNTGGTESGKLVPNSNSSPVKKKTYHREIPKKETRTKVGKIGTIDNREKAADRISPIEGATISLNVIPWATISVDGVVLDSLARQKQLSLPPGKHRVVLSHPEFSPKVLEIETRAGEQRVIRYSFYQDAGFLQVEVRPWAAVYIDGRFVDNTPLKHPLPLSPGEHLIELKNPYYETIRKYVEINRGDTLMIREILKNR